MSTNPANIRSIFDQVVDLPPTERAAALGRLCGDDASLRAELEALLASHDAAHAGNFMTSPTAATTVRNAAITETAGSRVGPYKLLQVIGEGGFGTVFLAEQSEPVRRRVALKIIKLGMDTKQVIARFEAERQALALMDHPHIARVLDAGATPITEHGGGSPYFVMEYVVGDAITQFAANNNLDLRARLELFAQVCSAVQHAHTKGIIHRDIKPGNVLVTMTDGKPFARVIDFGIAKATSSAAGLTDKTLFTEHRQLIGTPEYMSPEQAQGSPDIDTRTDVYALGVLLYELLAGDTPFDGKRLRSAAWDEMRRIIKEEDPPTPSARVTQRMKIGGSASSPTDPVPLRPSAPSDLRGELDWIVMKSLDKDRARRYETPSALAADVLRHLKGEAVQAAPPSAAYRLKKFVRRNKGPVIAGSAVAAALLVGIAGTTWQYLEAEHQAFVAGSNAARAYLAQQEAEWSAYTANLALAQAAMDAGNWPEARERLRQCPESKRGWEWEWLNGKAASITAEVRSSFSVVSPEARLIASMDGGSLQMFRTDGTPVSARTEVDGQISWATFSENGQRLLIACYAGPQMDRLKVFDLDGRRIGGDAAVDVLAINSASISPDGSSIAVSTTDANGNPVIAIHNTDGSMRAILADASRTYLAHTWSPDSSRLAAISANELRVWTRDGTPIASIPMASTPHFRPDGAEIVFLIDEKTAATWPIGEATFNTTLNHEGKVGYVGYSPDGRTIYTTCADNLLRLWRDAVEVARIPCDLYEHPVFSPDGAHFVVKNSRSLTVFDADGTPVAPPLAHADGVQSFCFAPDGNSIYSSDSNCILHWSLDGRLIGRTAIGTRIGYPQCLPDGRVIATLLTDEGGETYNRVLLSVTSGEGERRIPPISADFARLEADAILHDGRLADRTPGGTPISEEHAREISPDCVVWAASPDGKRLVSATPDRVVRFWDVDSKKEVASLRLDADVASLAFTEDGTRLVVMLMNGAARFLDARSRADQAASHARRDAEVEPARAYLDSLLAGPTPTAELEIAVIDDASHTPLRRLVAAEMLQGRIAEIHRAAESTFDRIKRDAERATDSITMVDTKAIKAHITGAAAALQPSDALPPRAIEMVIARAADWEYIPSEPSTEDRLAEEEKKRRLAEADVAVRSVDAGAGDQQAAIDRAAVLDAIRTYRVQRVTHDESRYQAILAALATVSTRKDRYVWAESALRAGDLSYALNLILEAPRDRLMPLAGPKDGANEPESVKIAWTEATPCELTILAMVRFKLMTAAPESIAAAARIDQRILGSAMSADELQAAARAALSRARAIMSDPSALDDSGRPWSENPDAQALLKEAEELIGPHGSSGGK